MPSLLAPQSPESHNVCLFLTLHRWEHQATLIYSTSTYTISPNIITVPPPTSFLPPPSPADATTASSSHATLPVLNTVASIIPFPVAHSLHWFDHDSENEHEANSFLFQGQILIQTMNLLLIYNCLYLFYLSMVNSQEEKQEGELRD